MPIKSETEVAARNLIKRVFGLSRLAKPIRDDDYQIIGYVVAVATIKDLQVEAMRLDGAIVEAAIVEGILERVEAVRTIAQSEA